MTSAMERIVNLSDMPERLRGGVVAIGNFDGVHRGHRVVLERALEEAKVIGAPPLVLTFDPVSYTHLDVYKRQVRRRLRRLRRRLR